MLHLIRSLLEEWPPLLSQSASRAGMQNTALRALCTADRQCGAVQISAGRWGLTVGGGREVTGWRR